MMMSSAEFKVYERLTSNVGPTKAGRLGFKRVLSAMMSLVIQLEAPGGLAIVRLSSDSGDIATLFVDAVRMDVSNQTVFFDAACIQLHDGLDFESSMALPNPQDHDVLVIIADDDQVPFWKQFLPVFAERCRQWTHKPSCEYRSNGKIPLCTLPGKQYMCGCGIGVFPETYLEKTKESKMLCKHATRVAIPLIFSSPISPDEFVALSPSIPSSQNSALDNSRKSGCPVPSVQDLAAKKDACFVCRAKTAKTGESLLKCSRCKIAQYCSADCQQRDWKAEHKRVCKQLQLQ